MTPRKRALMRLQNPASAGGNLPAVRAPEVFVVPDDLAEAAKEYMDAAHAANTHKARAADWAVFEAWCASRGYVAMPATPLTVYTFIIDCAKGSTLEKRKPATIKRYLSSISTAHGAMGYRDVQNPVKDVRIKEQLAGICHKEGTRQRQAAPLTTDLLERILATTPNARDWAILCFGQATACRRSELCALDVKDLAMSDRGVAVFLARSKTDQEGKGFTLGVERRDGPLCPVQALQHWLRWYGARSGPLFVSLNRGGGPTAERLGVRAVNLIVKAAVESIGLDPTLYSGHSLRSGYVTDQRRAGKSWAAIMEHTRHEELKTVKGYARYERDPFQRVDE